MLGKSASFFFGLGLNIIFGILQITVVSMPTIVAVLGYTVGGGFMILGIIGFLRSRKEARKKAREREERESRPQWPL